MKILILTNGEYGDYSFCKDIKKYDRIICADNGMRHARYMQIIPDLILGDFDSSQVEDLEYFKAINVPIEQFQTMKDETDTELAIDKAISLGAKEIDVFGGLGSRMDHSLGNIHLLYKALKRGVKATLINPNNRVTLINKEIELSGKVGDLVSLLPLTERVVGVKTLGLAYALEEGIFEMGKPYGVSNYMTQETVKIEIKEGALLVIQAID